MNDGASGPAPGPTARRPIWREAFALLRAHRRALLGPVAVTQLPMTVISAAAYFVLMDRVYPEVPYDSFDLFDDAPETLILWLVAMNATFWLFTLVGMAGAVVAARGALEGQTVALPEALDPGFSRMGGLLALGIAFYVILLASVAGILVLIYLAWRFGLAFHAFVLDGKGVTGAFGQSWSMLRGNMWRFAGTLVTLLPVSLAMLFVGSFAAVIAVLPFAAEDAGRTTTLAGNAVAVGVLGVFGVPVTAYFATATTLFYRRLQGEQHG